MNPIMTKLMANKHTSAAGLAYGIAALIAHLGNTWFPGHEQQFADSVNAIKEFAIIYGLAMAGDSKPPTNPPPGIASEVSAVKVITFFIIGCLIAEAASRII